MRSLLRDTPPVAWLITALISVRTAVMAVMVLGLSALINSQLNPGSTDDLTSFLVLVIITTVGAGGLLVVENILPGRLRVKQEAAWRQELARKSLTLGPDTSRDDAQVITEATDATEKASTYT
ncbi:MAG: ABC transporter ATP-binding protein, partial [Corynebacterium sp.]|nr:ABC transporter ATP-binding protein [Corynebacterium sp.]